MLGILKILEYLFWLRGCGGGFDRPMLVLSLVGVGIWLGKERDNTPTPVDLCFQPLVRYHTESPRGSSAKPFAAPLWRRDHSSWAFERPHRRPVVAGVWRFSWCPLVLSVLYYCNIIVFLCIYITWHLSPLDICSAEIKFMCLSYFRNTAWWTFIMSQYLQLTINTYSSQLWLYFIHIAIWFS